MGRDRVLKDGDYVRGANGSWETTTSAATKAYHQLRTARNTWAGDPTAGADFHTLERKDSEAEIARAANMTKAAMQRLVDKGVIRDLKIETGRDQANRPVVQWTAVDVQSGEAIAGSEVLPYGA